MKEDKAMADIVEEAMKVIALTEGMAIHCIRSRLQVPGTRRCEVCGEDIPAARRALMPSATTCVTCQEAREHRLKTGVPGS
jgi:phage/conjugal plasmid C-4 type zinc finger TraR family protein